MNSHSLKTRWTWTTTIITFIIFMLFSFFIIWFISLYLRGEEKDTAYRSTLDSAELFKSKSLGDMSRVDIAAALQEGEKVIYYSTNGQPIIEASNDKNIQYTPTFTEVDRVTMTEEIQNGQGYLVFRAPVQTGYAHGYITVVHSMAKYHAVMQYMIILAGFFGVSALFITAIISYIFSRQITKPIRSLSNQMKQIQRDGFQNNLTLPKSYYETDDMIETFNNLMTQLEHSFDQQKQFVEDASHELRTPLQIIQGHLNLIKRWGKNNPEVLEESLSISLDEMNRITKLVEELLLLTKENQTGETKELEPVLINQEIDSRLKSLKQLHPGYQFEFHTTNPNIRLNINRYQFEQMLLIFLDNAIKYDTEQKHIVIRTTLKNKVIQLEIIDHGVGIPDHDLQNVFDRFYRVDKSRARTMGGNGLGLSIAKKIIENNNGTVKIESEVGKFTKVIIQFFDRNI